MLITNFCFVFLLGVGVDKTVSKTLGYKEIKEYFQRFNRNELGDSDEIVGGDVVDIKQYPYQVSMIEIIGDGEWKALCGGSIISEDYVLTAAHCPSENFYLQVGGSLAIDDAGAMNYNVSKIVLHPKYNSSSPDYDVAVLKTSRKIIPNGITTKAVRLPDSTSFLKTGDNVIVTGWGDIQSGGPSSNVLRAVTVPVISKEYCSKAYAATKIQITDRMLCAGFDKGGKDACQSDSGGPAVDEKNLVQYGIVSFGEGCALPGNPGVYTYIPTVRAWIKEVTGV